MDARTHDEEWRDLLHRQCGVVTLAQCRDAGLTKETVAGHVRAGRWRRMDRRVRLTEAAPPSYAQRVWAGLLAVGGPVAVSHETALWWVDRSRPAPPLVHVAVHDARGVPSRPGVRVHHLPDLDSERVHPGLPLRVRVEHTVVDLERLCETGQALVALVTSVVSARLTTVQLLREVVDARPRVRWREELELVLADVEEGAMSPLEVEDLRNDRRHGLPVGNRQRGRTRAGHKEYVDVVYALPGLRPVAKELDGRLDHSQGA